MGLFLWANVYYLQHYFMNLPICWPLSLPLSLSVFLAPSAFLCQLLCLSKICHEETCKNLYKYPVGMVQRAIWKANKNQSRDRSRQTLIQWWLHCCLLYSWKNINNTRCLTLMFLCLCPYSHLFLSVSSQKWSFFRVEQKLLQLLKDSVCFSL